MGTGPGVEGGGARVRRGVGFDGIIIGSGDERNRGIMLGSSACCATVCTTALGEMIKVSVLKGKPLVSKEVE